VLASGTNVKLRVGQAGGKDIGLPGQSKSSIEHLEHPSITKLYGEGKPLGEDIYRTTENFSTSHDGA
jgi:hypothetical protein